MDFTDAIRVLMLTRGETQQDIADLLGVSRQAVMLKLNGHRRFRLDEVRTILKHYEITPEQLYQIFFET